MKLRDYQQECLATIKQRYHQGVTRQLVVLPTASGKSLIFSHIPASLGLTGQHYLLVHREELVTQAARHFERANPGLKIGIERAQDRADATNDDIIVASVQTLGHPSGSRLKRLNAARCANVTVDEVHHIISPAYKSILQHFGLNKSGDNHSPALLVGVTATSTRGDGLGLEGALDEIVFQRDIREMIQAGWLVNIEAYRIETTTDLSGVKSSYGDFAVNALDRVVNTPQRNQLIVDKYLELGCDRAGIAFTASVNHSHALAMAFRRAGIAALPFSGMTPGPERDRLLSAHQSGEVKILISANALLEGTDLPWAEIGLMAKPTRSSLLFTQAVGRLLRPYPAPEEGPPVKTRALILDFCDIASRHRLCTVPSLFGLRPDFNLKGQSVTEALEEIETAQEKFQQLALDSFTDLATMRSLVESIDLLKPPRIPDILRQYSELSWTEGPGGSYQLIGDTAHFSVRENQLGQFEMYQHVIGTRRLLKMCPDLASSLKAAEAALPPEERQLLRSSAKWRSGQPSDEQIKFLSRLDSKLYRRFSNMEQFRSYVLTTFNKGDVSALISERLSQQKNYHLRRQ